MKARLWELQTEMHRRSGRSLVAREMQTLASDCTHNARASTSSSTEAAELEEELCRQPNFNCKPQSPPSQLHFETADKK